MARGKEAGATVALSPGTSGTRLVPGTKMATSARSTLLLTVSYFEYATTPETSQKLKETVYITCAWLGRCSKFDIAARKLWPHERMYKRSYDGSWEDASHSLTSALVASASPTDVSN